MLPSGAMESVGQGSELMALKFRKVSLQNFRISKNRNRGCFEVPWRVADNDEQRSLYHLLHINLLGPDIF